VLSVDSNLVACSFEEFQSCSGPTEGGTYIRTALGAGTGLAGGTTTTAPTGSGELEQALASSVKVSRQTDAISLGAGTVLGEMGISGLQFGGAVDLGLQQVQHLAGLIGKGGRRLGAQGGDGGPVLGSVIAMDEDAGGDGADQQSDGGALEAGDHSPASIIAWYLLIRST
jgi:hypothetical protein